MRKEKAKTWPLYVGPLVAIIVGVILYYYAGLNPKACITAAITSWCAVWWVFEPMPIEATAIIPFALFPMFGVINAKQAAASYGKEVVLLFIGAFMLAKALEKSGTHRRLAIGMVKAVGGVGGRRLVLGFILASAVLSMWLSNTATTIMLIPVIIAILEDLDEHERKILAVPLLMGLVIGVNIGGVGTPVGTPPNLICKAIFEEFTGRDITFPEWMKIGVPVVAIMIPVTWLWLSRGLGKAKPVKLPVLGPWRAEEKRTLTIFILTALAWFFRTFPDGGWCSLLNVSAGVSTVPMLAVMIMLVCPNGHGGTLLDWKTAKNIPWGLLVVVGGSLTIGTAFNESGLSKVIGDTMAGLSSWSKLGMILAISVSAGFVTNMMNHTAMASLLMPILAASSISTGIDPIQLMLPAAMAISLAFMMPIATMSNMIIYDTGHIRVRTMIKEGFIPNLIGVLVVGLMCYLMLVVFAP